MKYLCLLILYISFINHASAQVIPKKQIAAGGVSDDEITAGIIRTTDGGFLAGGYSFSYPGTYKTAPNYGSGDYWIIKYDRNGNKQFDKSFGSNQYEAMYSIIQTADGGYLLGGTSPTGVSGTKTAAGNGAGDMWLVKTDKLGNQFWNKAYGGSGDDGLNSIAQTKDGGYIFCGSSFSNISGDKTENGFGNSDYWVVKVDAAGNKQWDRTFGGDQNDVGLYAAQTGDGSYIVAGQSSSGRSGNKTSNPRGVTDIWVVKLDSLGNKLGDRTIGGDKDDLLQTMESTTDGGFLLGSYSFSGISGDKTEDTKGGADFWLVKIDEDANILWQKGLGSSSYDYLTGVKQTNDGGYIVAGYSNGRASGDKTENNWSADFDNWVVKLSSNRTVEWDKTIGGLDEDQAGINSIVQINDGLYLLGSNSISSVGGNKTVPSRGDFDFWLSGIQYNPLALTDKIAATPSLSAIASTFSIAPNPVKEVMHVFTEGKATVILSNADGKQLLTKVINVKDDISVSRLPAGSYYLTNTTTGEIKKVMIVK